MKTTLRWTLCVLAIGLLCACESEKEKQAKLPLYDRLGGETQIRAIVDDFVHRVAIDPDVNFSRQGTRAQWQATPENIAKLEDSLVDYIESVSGGPRTYHGRDMKSVHAGMQITGDQFAAFINDLRASLDHFNIKDPTETQLLNKFVAARPQMVVEPVEE